MKRILILSLVAMSSLALADDYTGVGGVIPDNDPVGATYTINVPVAIASVVSVTMTGLSHTWVGDCTFTLFAPDGSFKDLVARIGRTGGTGVGDSSNYNGDYKFIDGGASIWTEATLGDSTYNLRSGNYAASGVDNAAVVLGSFAPQVAGDWKLLVKDEASLDTGTFRTWTLTANPVPEPFTMVAMAAGVAALARRRRK